MNQPRALISLFLTEMWERFGFYIIQGLLVLYMTNYLSFSDTKSYAILGEYTALAYISPIIGGYLADRLMGYRYSIIIGAVMLCAGYALIATTRLDLLYIGFALAILGNGFLKPNISSFLGDFYDEDDPRREAGFTIFYMGINIGVMLSTLSSGIIQRNFGWNAVFATAAVGMLIAIASFYFGFKYFKDKGLPTKRADITPSFLKILASKTNFIIFLVLSTLGIYLLMISTDVGDIFLIVMGVILLVTLLYTSTSFEKSARNKFFALITLIIISIIFWGLFFQIFFSATLFIERNVDRTIGGFQIPTVAFISLEAIFIILLGPLFAKLWQSLSISNRNLSLGLKFSLAMFAVAASLSVLALAIHLTPHNELVNPVWIIFAYLLITIGELFLSPIGLSMVTTLAPKHLVGLMMGVWFMALGFGGQLAGYLAKQASIPNGMKDLALTNSIYQHAFMNYAALALIAGLVLLILTPWLKKLTDQ